MTITLFLISLIFIYSVNSIQTGNFQRIKASGNSEQYITINEKGEQSYDDLDYSSILKGSRGTAPPDIECEFRKLAYTYAKQIQPKRKDYGSIFDGLELASMCNQAKEQVKPSDTEKEIAALKKRIGADTSYYVSPTGSNSNSGSFLKPFKTIQHGISACKSASGNCYVIVRAGDYFLGSTIQLDTTNNGLRLVGYPGEYPNVSGGIPIVNPKWEPYKIEPPKWSTYQNANNVYGRIVIQGDTESVKYLGEYDTAAGCEAACKQYTLGDITCHSWTFHSPQLSKVGRQCYGVIDDTWGPTPDKMHTSGRVSYANIYKTDLSGTNIKEIPGLLIDGNRAVRARYPHANPEFNLFPNGWMMQTGGWGPINTGTPVPNFHYVTSPNRSKEWSMFQNYMLGMNGTCDVYEPPESFWCSKHPSGGGAFVYTMFSGLTYLEDSFLGTKFNDLVGSIVHLFHPYHWALWFFEVSEHNPTTNWIGWQKGGFQGSRGAHHGGQWFIDDVFEVLDTPNEYYFDKKTQQLYYFHNGTGTVPEHFQFVATNLQTLISIKGTQSKPVKNIYLDSLKFTGAAHTYMTPHGVPSGGDFAMQYLAAVILEGTEQITITNNIFTKCDGLGLFIFGYNRDTQIIENDFTWLGGTAMVAWGQTKFIDGTSGSQPRKLNVVGNLVHDYGVYEKQSVAWFQAKSAQISISKNVMFNGPRGGINYNDGFGGGNEIFENLVFNQCRETQDGGPFNSWDRQPFLTDVATGAPSLVPAYNEIHHNFWICNYGSSMCIDNDDGSSYYKNHHNVEIYGGHKSDYGGHNKFTYNSVVLYAQDYAEGLCGMFNNAVPGYVDGYYNNTCVQVPTIPYLDLSWGSNACDLKAPETLPKLGNNKVYNAEANVTVKCESTIYTLEAWQKLGQDIGTTAHYLPSYQTMEKWIVDLLSIKV